LQQHDYNLHVALRRGFYQSFSPENNSFNSHEFVIMHVISVQPRKKSAKQKFCTYTSVSQISTLPYVAAVKRVPTQFGH
jgi:hypothetical protein